MAAEESSQGDALGPDFSEPTGGGPPAEPETIDLRVVLVNPPTAVYPPSPRQSTCARCWASS
jgi:hypothetical protein